MKEEIEKLKKQVAQYKQAWSDVCNENQELLNDLARHKEAIDKFRLMILHTQADKWGTYFICGGSAPSKDGLPDMLHVCPGVNINGYAVYIKKTDVFKTND